MLGDIQTWTAASLHIQHEGRRFLFQRIWMHWITPQQSCIPSRRECQVLTEVCWKHYLTDTASQINNCFAVQVTCIHHLRNEPRRGLAVCSTALSPVEVLRS